MQAPSFPTLALLVTLLSHSAADLCQVILMEGPETSAAPGGARLYEGEVFR